jgi:hypothetical protein
MTSAAARAAHAKRTLRRAPARGSSAVRLSRGGRPCSTPRRRPCRCAAACRRRNRGTHADVAGLDRPRLLPGRVVEVRLDPSPATARDGRRSRCGPGRSASARWGAPHLVETSQLRRSPGASTLPCWTSLLQRTRTGHCGSMLLAGEAEHRGSRSHPCVPGQAAPPHFDGCGSRRARVSLTTALTFRHEGS